ncbi:MAG TPA: LUD domain-containing protein [Candidatus Angelobacter sp.]|jgi:L-lactate dehydrogenase complex protein LldG|nr:LUD domain-containing protein [Candidatus Angelobacter sp.]
MAATTALIEDFVTRLRAVDGSVDVVAGVPAARDRISALCAEAGGTAVATAAASSFAPGAEVAGDDLARIVAAATGVSHALLGVAETGSVLLAPASRRERLVSLLPPLHIVVLDAATLLASLDGAAAAMRSLMAAGAAYVSLVTGPSRTADIERVITVGAHGPRRVHVVVVGEGSRG